MAKDQRYDTVKFLLEGGRIKTFMQIFEHIPKSVVANNLGTNYNRLAKMLDQVDLFTLKEIFQLGSLFDINEKEMLDLVYQQHVANKNNRLKT